MKYKSEPQKNYESEEIDYDMLSDRNSVASATECTGLMYAPPEDEYEAESTVIFTMSQRLPIKQKKS